MEGRYEKKEDARYQGGTSQKDREDIIIRSLFFSHKHVFRTFLLYTSTVNAD